jgi:hypothetical protein
VDVGLDVVLGVVVKVVVGRTEVLVVGVRVGVGRIDVVDWGVPPHEKGLGPGIV